MKKKQILEELDAHTAWCAEKMQASRAAIGDGLCAIGDDSGNVAANPAMASYLSLAKEYRCAARQLSELLDEEEEQPKSSLSSLRAFAGKRAV